MKIKYILLLAMTTVLLAGCDYSKPGNRTGFFYNTFARPMDNLLHWLGNNESRLRTRNYHHRVGYTFNHVAVYVGSN